MKLDIALVMLGLFALASAQSPLWGQCGGTNYNGPKSCVSDSCCVFTNEWYSQCVPCNNQPPPASSHSTSQSTTNSPSPTQPPPADSVTTTLPQSAGVLSTGVAIVVKGSYDGGMRRYERSPNVCKEQDETGEADASFILEDGATLSNVIIGASSAEGVHCRGTCTLNNVWWSDVCEDAATFKQPSGSSYVNGGGAFKAADKIFQFNGGGTVSIRNFYANDYGKLIRSCGTCSNNGGPRNIVIDGVVATGGAALCGINVNYGDTCRITNSCQNDQEWCDRYTGNALGNEPIKLGEGPDGRYCTTSNIRTNC